MSTLVIAHRGASWDEPENTLPAFERAIELGADFIEFDVHALDGCLVVVHDLPRPGRSYPTLEEALDLMHGRIGVMVELKRPYHYRRQDVVRRTLDLLDGDDVLVCFESGALREAHRLRPGLRLLQHVGFGVSIDRAARYAWAAGFADRLVTPRGIARSQSQGLATIVYTVNEPERMHALDELGVTGIVTDRPDLMQRTLASPRPRPG